MYLLEIIYTNSFKLHLYFSDLYFQWRQFGATVSTFGTKILNPFPCYHPTQHLFTKIRSFNDENHVPVVQGDKSSKYLSTKLILLFVSSSNATSIKHG